VFLSVNFFSLLSLTSKISCVPALEPPKPGATAKGVLASTAQKILGHSDIRMTLAIYTHATDDMQDAAKDALEVGSGAGQTV
jgi:hypothetical protein